MLYIIECSNGQISVSGYYGYAWSLNTLFPVWGLMTFARLLNNEDMKSWNGQSRMIWIIDVHNRTHYTLCEVWWILQNFKEETYKSWGVYYRVTWNSNKRWWSHQMEAFSALLAICAGKSPVPVKSPNKDQWRGALMFSLICVWINGWVNNREAGDLTRYRAHYDVTVMRRIIKQIDVEF